MNNDQTVATPGVADEARRRLLGRFKRIDDLVADAGKQTTGFDAARLLAQALQEQTALLRDLVALLAPGRQP
jgi:hypothetical protein